MLLDDLRDVVAAAHDRDAVHALAAQRRVVVDEADGAVGLRAVVLQLPGQQLPRIAGADDQHALLRLVGARRDAAGAPEARQHARRCRGTGR